MYDVGQPQLENVRRTIHANFEALINYQLLSKDEADEVEGRVYYTTDMAEAIEHRGAKTGKTFEELTQCWDRMLINFLKLHKK